MPKLLHRLRESRLVDNRVVRSRPVRAVGRVVREALHDGITGEAAKIAYYFFLSLFPMILALFAFTGILGGQEAFDWIMGHLRRALPGEASRHLEAFVQEITGSSRPGMLSFGLLLSVWAASNAFSWLTRGLNVMYDISEGRPWWKRRGLSVIAMLTTLAILTVSSVALLSGPRLAAWFGLGPIWDVVRWPAVWVLITLMLALIYYLLPNRDQRHAKRPVMMGALVGTGLWIVATLAFRFYVQSFGDYSATYGVVGGIIVMLLWLYLTAFAILFGGEVAATLEQVASEKVARGGSEPAAGADEDPAG